MDADEVAARIGKLLDLRQENAVGGHQMHVDRARRDLPDTRDQIGKKQHRRREVAIGDVDVENIDIGIDPGEIVGEAQQIRRPDGKFADQSILGKISDPVLGRISHCL